MTSTSAPLRMAAVKAPNGAAARTMAMARRSRLASPELDTTSVSITLPPRVSMTIMATEPVVKGQTASSSYKPATMENGARVMVPPHIDVGTRIVINTEDNGYVERAKD